MCHIKNIKDCIDYIDLYKNDKNLQLECITALYKEVNSLEYLALTYIEDRAPSKNEKEDFKIRLKNLKEVFKELVKELKRPKEIIIPYTDFINALREAKAHFDCPYNSTNFRKQQQSLSEVSYRLNSKYLYHYRYVYLSK